jgi:hypothetical protein
VFGEWREATVCDEPLFDPTNSRVRAAIPGPRTIG